MANASWGLRANCFQRLFWSKLSCAAHWKHGVKEKSEHRLSPHMEQGLMLLRCNAGGLQAYWSVSSCVFSRSGSKVHSLPGGRVSSRVHMQIGCIVAAAIAPHPGCLLLIDVSLCFVTPLYPSLQFSVAVELTFTIWWPLNRVPSVLVLKTLVLVSHRICCMTGTYEWAGGWGSVYLSSEQPFPQLLSLRHWMGGQPLKLFSFI